METIKLPDWLGELEGKNRLNLNTTRSLRPGEAITQPHTKHTHSNNKHYPLVVLLTQVCITVSFLYFYSQNQQGILWLHSLNT